MIEFIKLKCPSCGADLNVDNGLDTFFCQYCGAKILLHGQNSDALQAKAKVKIVETEANKELEMQKEKHRAEKEEREFKEKVSKKAEKEVIIMAVVMLIVCSLVLSCFSFVEKREVKELNSLYSEILIDIQNKDYDIALLKANRLRTSVSTQPEAVKQEWDETRENLIKQIESLKSQTD